MVDFERLVDERIAAQKQAKRATAQEEQARLDRERITQQQKERIRLDAIARTLEGTELEAHFSDREVKAAREFLDFMRRKSLTERGRKFDIATGKTVTAPRLFFGVINLGIKHDAPEYRTVYGHLIGRRVPETDTTQPQEGRVFLCTDGKLREYGPQTSTDPEYDERAHPRWDPRRLKQWYEVGYIPPDLHEVLPGLVETGTFYKVTREVGGDEKPSDYYTVEKFSGSRSLEDVLLPFAARLVDLAATIEPR